MTNAQVWIGDEGPFAVDRFVINEDATLGTLERIEDEEHENWEECSIGEWARYGLRVQEEGTAQLAVSCSSEHEVHGRECLDCWGVSQPWTDRHAVHLLISAEALQRIEDIGVTASYRETVLRQRNRRRLTEERSRR